MTSDLIATHGPDSSIGRFAAVLQGSTDTTFYVLTVYFGAVGIKKMGDALKVGLLADLVGIILAIVDSSTSMVKKSFIRISILVKCLF